MSTERSWLLPLSRASRVSCGGKAATVAQLRERGLPVPDGFCLTTAAYRAASGRPPVVDRPAEVPLTEVQPIAAPVRQRLADWRPGRKLSRALAEAAGALGWPLIVRSSASCEDLPGASTAGVFLSLGEISDLTALLDAIRRCWDSLWQLPAWAVLRRQQRWPGSEAMAVLLQPMLHSISAGLALRVADRGALQVEAVPGAAEPLARGEVDPRALTIPEAGDLVVPPGFPLSADDLQQLRGLTRAAEAALAQPSSTGDQRAAPDAEADAALEFEWIHDGQRIWLVQARPLTRGSAPAIWSPTWIDPDDAQRSWRWDSEHNPAPLSPAHAGLIARLGRPAQPARYRVLNGYLYRAVDDRGTQRAPAWDTARALLGGLLEQLERAERAEPGDTATQLAQALEFFCDFHRAYETELGAARRRVRLRLEGLLAQIAPQHALGTGELAARLSVGPPHDGLRRAEALYRLGHARRGAASAAERAGVDDRPSWRDAFLQQHGKLVAVWDLAQPTWAEQPQLLDAAAAALSRSGASPLQRHARQQAAADALLDQLCGDLSSGEAEILRQRVAQAREARASSEEDDLLFARALWIVRSALLRAGEQLATRGALASPQQVFWLELPRVQDALVSTGAGDLAADAEAALRAWRRACRQLPPPTIDRGQPRWPPPPAGDLIEGKGVGGTTQARARVVREGARLLDADLVGRVVVCPTVLPALAVVLPQVAALVTDHGGLLSHAACLARELGIPTVVGASGASGLLCDDDLVWVDGDRGRVVRLARADSDADNGSDARPGRR